ncbi:hypothetical protein ACET3Z_030968 [Daucus carota]
MVIKRNLSDLGLAAILCTSHAALHCYWEASSYYTSRKLQQNSISEEMDQFGLPFSPILNELIFPRQEQDACRHSSSAKVLTKHINCNLQKEVGCLNLVGAPYIFMLKESSSLSILNSSRKHPKCIVDTEFCTQNRSCGCRLPVLCVPSNDISDERIKHLRHQRNCSNQIFKAAMAITSSILAEMEIPDTYMAALPEVIEQPFQKTQV